MISAARLLAVLAASATVVAGCSGDGGPEVPTEAQAREALDAKFQQARTGDADAFCDDTDIPEMCKGQWERRGGQEAVPEEKPRIVDVREQDGYRVVRVCGTDGRGQDYRSDFVVGLDDGAVTYVLPVFWNGATFSGVHGDDTGKVDPATPEPVTCS